MPITADKLTKTYKDLKYKYEGCKEDYFAPLFISEKFGKPIESIITKCAFGNNDYGIDGYYIEKEAKNLYLYQFKWSDNYELFKESYKRLIKDGIEIIFGDLYIDPKVNEVINQLKLEMQEYKDLINKVYICFVFNGEPEKAEGSRVLESFREELESKKHLIDSYFNNPEITLTIQYVSNETTKINQISSTKKTFSYKISYKAQSEKKVIGNETLNLGFINIFDLYNMFLEMKQRLFEKNIRAGLSDDLAPNKAIRKSLQDIVVHNKIQPEYFTFHHNGVTLFAENLVMDNESATIVEPRVLNGAQTITTLSRFIESIQKHPNYTSYVERLKKIEVIGKIITNCSQDFITQVTISNNKQNPVESWNLRANDLIQLEFEDKFSKNGIFYERQQNSFSNLRYSDLEELGIEQTKEIKIIKLAQTFLALQGEIDKVSEISKVFETDNIYDKTFRAEYLKADIRKIIICYKVQFRLNAIIKEIESKGENKYYFIRYARNLVWALTIQGLLNDNSIEDLLEKYGYRLSVEADFNSIVKEIGSKKIRQILSELINQKTYHEYMREEKFSFLKTKNVFIDCMAIAKKKFKWDILKITD